MKGTFMKGTLIVLIIRSQPRLLYRVGFKYMDMYIIRTWA